MEQFIKENRFIFFGNPKIKRNYRKKINIEKKECENCGETNKLHAHHIIHRAKGGSDERPNIMVLCNTCHREQHLELPEKLFI